MQLQLRDLGREFSLPLVTGPKRFWNQAGGNCANPFIVVLAGEFRLPLVTGPKRFWNQAGGNCANPFIVVLAARGFYLHKALT